MMTMLRFACSGPMVRECCVVVEVLGCANCGVVSCEVRLGGALTRGVCTSLRSVPFM